MPERLRTGTVTAFDAQRGLGEVSEPDGDVHPFHCVQIADGTRDIAVGTPVTFELGPATFGRWEARSLESRP